MLIIVYYVVDRGERKDYTVITVKDKLRRNKMTLETTITERDNARNIFESLKPNTKKWREAEEDLNFWQSKVAMIEAM